MKIAKKAALCAVVASVVTVGLPMMASADAGDQIHGQCSVNTQERPFSSDGQNSGVIEVSAEMLTSANTPDARASVGCKIQVNGVDAPGTEIDVAADAAGFVQGQAQISFDDQGGTLPSALCERDNWGDDDTSGWVCQGEADFQVIEPLNQLKIDDVDPVVCPPLATIGGSGFVNNGAVSVHSDGDVYVADPLGLGVNPVYDCSPYGNDSPPPPPPSPCTTAEGQVVCASLSATTPQGTYTASGVAAAPGPVAGYVDSYTFTLPNGGVVTLPCAVLVSGSTTTDPCAAAGGTYVSTLETLQTPSVASNPFATVNVCNANLVLTVDGLGVNSFPALVVC